MKIGKEKSKTEGEISITGGTPQVSSGENAQNIQAQTHVNEQTINYYMGVSPHQTDVEELSKAQMQLEKLIVDTIPEPAPMPEGSRFPNIRPNPLFVGREKELKQMAFWLKGNNPIAIGQMAAFHGMGGIGKTQLAAEFAHRYGQFFLGGVFWLDFSNSNTVSSEIAATGTLGDSFPLDERVNTVLANWMNPIPRLLIFDNCDDNKLIVQWRPPTGGSRVLITSRQSQWNPDLGIMHLGIETLPREESVKLLHYFRDDLSYDDPTLYAIAEELGDLPLALHLAGSYIYIYKHEISPSQYLTVLRNTTPSNHESMKNEGFSPTGHDLDIGRTFEVSIQRLIKNGSNSLPLKIMDYVACFAPGLWIPRKLLKESLGSGTEDKLFADGVRSLLGLGLIEENNDGDVWMHRLLAGYISISREVCIAKQAVEEAIGYWAASINENGFPEKMQPVFSHLRYITINALERSDEIASQLALILGDYLFSIADYNNSIYYLKKALVITYSISGRNSDQFSRCLTSLGAVYQRSGNLNKARLCFTKEFEITKKVFGEKHFKTTVSLHNLSSYFHERGENEKAQIYLGQSIKQNNKITIEERSLYATSLNVLAMVLLDKNNFTEALQNLEKSLEIRKEVLGEVHPMTAITLNNLGYFYYNKGEMDKSLYYNKQALTIRKKVFGKEHPDTANSLYNIGTNYEGKGNIKLAKHYYVLALRILKKSLGLEHKNSILVQEQLLKVT